jgi:hypothetical protein
MFLTVSANASNMAPTVVWSAALAFRVEPFAQAGSGSTTAD